MKNWPTHLSALKPAFKKEAYVLALVALSFLLAKHLPADESLPKNATHTWQVISYPASDGKMHPNFSLRPGDKDEALTLYIEFNGPKLEKGHGIAARLHRENGEIVDAVGGNLDNPVAAMETVNPYGPGHVNTDWSATTTFPWGKNTLETAWIEVSLGEDRYWLEIPYGFDRNPRDPLPPPVSEKEPTIDPAMKPLTANDHVVSWDEVTYDFGKIQNGWGLTLNQSSDEDGKSEVVLYREDTVIGKSIYLWDLHSPRTQVHVFDSDGTEIDSMCVNIHLDEDGFRRRDSFNLNRYPSDLRVRCWGQIEVTVDNKKSRRLVIPSSLYKFSQGHASN